MSTTVLPRSRGVALDLAATVVAAATLLGLALRLAASSGDLGLDEVWSLRLVGRVHDLGGVFWGISHDNNHALNSAWLFLVGPAAPIWVDRLPAVVLGTLTVPALARLCGRWTASAGVLAALFGAVTLPLVDFGSEARGYAGLALATVLAFDSAARAGDAVRAGDAGTRRREAWRLGAAIGLGMLCHLTMAFTLAAVGLAILVRPDLQRRPRPALRRASLIIMPAVLLSLPATGFLLAGIALRGSFTIGDVDPFTAGKLAQGFGGMMLLAAGLPNTLPPFLGIAGSVALLAIAARHRLASPATLALGLAALVALPIAMAALRLPNVVYPRYFSLCALVLLALLAETLGTIWNRPGTRRAAALAAAAAMAGSLALDGAQVRDGRDSATETLALMAAEGEPTYGADRPFMAALLLDEAARRAGRPAPVPIADADTCRTSPRWFVAVGVEDRRPDGTAETGAQACPAHYDVRRVFPAAALSGTRWTLYRRE